MGPINPITQGNSCAQEKLIELYEETSEFNLNYA